MQVCIPGEYQTRPGYVQLDGFQSREVFVRSEQVECVTSVHEQERLRHDISTHI